MSGNLGSLITAQRQSRESEYLLHQSVLREHQSSGSTGVVTEYLIICKGWEALSPSYNVQPLVTHSHCEYCFRSTYGLGLLWRAWRTC